MQTHWRTKIAEEDLNDEQLLDRIDRLHQKITEMKNCQDGEMRLQATKSQVQYAPTLEKYGSLRESVSPLVFAGFLRGGHSSYSGSHERDRLEYDSGMAGVQGIPARDR